MSNQPEMSLERFNRDYESQPVWDIGQAQKRFIEEFDKAAPKSPVLDIGCGTGDLAIYAASLGCEVLGIDFCSKAIEIAQSRALENSSTAMFKVWDAFELEKLAGQFSTILDSCFFHTLDDAARRKYVGQLSKVIAPGGKLYLLNFAVNLPTPSTPIAVTGKDIQQFFQAGWSIKEIQTSEVSVTFWPTGIPATFACVEKNA